MISSAWLLQGYAPHFRLKPLWVESTTPVKAGHGGRIATMRVIIIFILLVVLGFVGWKAAERFKLIDTTPTEQAAPTAPTPDEAAPTPAPSLPSFDIVRVDRTGYAVIARSEEHT